MGHMYAKAKATWDNRKNNRMMRVGGGGEGGQRKAELKAGRSEERAQNGVERVVNLAAGGTWRSVFSSSSSSSSSSSFHVY